MLMEQAAPDDAPSQPLRSSIIHRNMNEIADTGGRGLENLQGCDRLTVMRQAWMRQACPSFADVIKTCLGLGGHAPPASFEVRP